MIPVWIHLNSKLPKLRKSNYLLVKSQISVEDLKDEACHHFCIDEIGDYSLV